VPTKMSTKSVPELSGITGTKWDSEDEDQAMIRGVALAARRNKDQLRKTSTLQHLLERNKRHPGK
jgi:hypothetical protein